MKRYGLLFLFVILIFSTEVYSAECEKITTCEELGFVQYENDCDKVGLPFIRCPFDTSKVYCPEDCRGYELNECDPTIGECARCQGTGLYKHTSCTAGYKLSDGKCTPEPKCVEQGFTGEVKEPLIGDIEYCWVGEEKLSRYKSCKNGWYYVQDPISRKYTCLENTCDGYIELEETCPHNGKCDNICYSGTTKKVKIECNTGLSLQDKGDIEGEGYKCRKHKIGNIAFYCKDATEIPEGLDTDGDQIITLEPEYYENKPEGCEAIGVVFDNDAKTKIIGLKDIGYDTTTGEFTEQTPTVAGYAAWGSVTTNVEELVDVTLAMSNTGDTIFRIDIDGASNTDAIIAWAKSGGHRAPAAEATRAYYPRLHLNSEGRYEEICPETSACGKGKWYLPSGAELKTIQKRQATGVLFSTAFSIIEQENSKNEASILLGYILSGAYLPSNEGSGTSSLRIATSSSGGFGQQSKTTGEVYCCHVRPVLVID